MTKEDMYIVKRKIQAVLHRIPYYICGLLPVKSNKIVFSAFEGGGYCCNPKYIVEELLRRQKVNGCQYELIWLVNDVKKEFPIEVKKVNNTLWRRAFHLSTAQIWVDNARKGYETRKRKKQYYILTWHGPIGFKAVGRLRGESFSKIAELVSRHDARLVDLLLSNSNWCSNIWKSAFWGEPVKILGSPRCDILINSRQEQYKIIRKKFCLAESAKFVIYAPTFRGGSQKQDREVFLESITLDFYKMITAFEHRFGGDWYVFLRLHPQLTLRMKSFQIECGTRIIDISAEDDLYEILAAADAFVSDYSSAAFDASYMKIPVFLYADDLEEYINDRGKLTWEIEDIPFPLARNTIDLVKEIEYFDMHKYLEKLNEVFERMNVLEDGKASERVADIIDEVISHGGIEKSAKQVK